MKSFVILAALCLGPILTGCEMGPHKVIGPTGVTCEATHTFRRDFSTHPGRTISIVYMTCGDCTPATTGFIGLGAKAHVCGPACSAPGYVCPVCKEHPDAQVRSAKSPSL